MAGRMPSRRPRKPSQVKNMQELLRLINQQRTAIGLPPVAVGSGADGSVVMETTAPPPRPRINSREQPPFPVGLEDPSKPLRDQDLFHGSNSLHYALQPDNTQIDWLAPPPPSGTDMAGYLDPSKAAMDGHLGPAPLYTTSDPSRAEMFGHLYKPVINADYSDFIGVNRRAMKPYGGQFARVQQSPSLLQGLAGQYENRVGHKMPRDITLREFNEKIANPTITQYLLDNNIDVDRVNALLDEKHRLEGMRGPATFQLQDYAFHSRGFVPANIEPVLERGGMAKGDGYGWQSLDAAHAAGKRAVQDSIVGSGAVGLTERYPNDPVTGMPQQHFAVYDKNSISSLIKLGLMLGAMKAGSNATASGITED